MSSRGTEYFAEGLDRSGDTYTLDELEEEIFGADVSVEIERRKTASGQEYIHFNALRNEGETATFSGDIFPDCAILWEPNHRSDGDFGMDGAEIYRKIRELLPERSLEDESLRPEYLP